MFICDDCLKPDDKIKSVFQSLGKCELCGKTRPCWDVNIHTNQSIGTGKDIESIKQWQSRVISHLKVIEEKYKADVGM